MANAASRDSHPLDAMLAISDVVTNQRYAQIYARVLTLDTPTVKELSEGLDSSTTTVYEDVKHLVMRLHNQRFAGCRLHPTTLVVGFRLESL